MMTGVDGFLKFLLSWLSRKVSYFYHSETTIVAVPTTFDFIRKHLPLSEHWKPKEQKRKEKNNNNYNYNNTSYNFKSVFVSDGGDGERISKIGQEETIAVLTPAVLVNFNCKTQLQILRTTYNVVHSKNDFLQQIYVSLESSGTNLLQLNSFFITSGQTQFSIVIMPSFSLSF
jgi:hypothetical protein